MLTAFSQTLAATDKMRATEKSWIEIGYRHFALEGPRALKIERISKEVGKNKSSFYHLFADIEIFTRRLLNYHYEQAKVIASKEAVTKNEHELIEILVNHKIDLLFNRQLRINRENPEFENCFKKIDKISLPAIMPIWKGIIGLSENSFLAEMVLVLSLENFYLQITDETLNEAWIRAFFVKIKEMVKMFKSTKATLSLDGTV